MSDRSVAIKITATNQASPALQQLAREAEAMGFKVEKAGQQAGRSLEDMKKRVDAVGTAIGTGIGIMSLAGQAYVSQEQQIRGLERAYGDAADEITQFAEDLQDSTTYSNDAARQAAQVASTLTRSYGLTADQVTQLIARTADLAAINVTSTGTQFDLVDAVSRTAGAIRGEGEAAEALGLTLSDSAVAAAAAARGLTGWNTTMSESEKAAFRFQLLMEQSTYAMGAASDAADTNTGKAKQLVNDIQDLTQAFGDSAGVAAEYAAVLGNLALGMPFLGKAAKELYGGLSALGLGAGALGPLALIAGGAGLAYGYSQDTYGSTTTNTATNEFFKFMSGLMNTVLPGSPYSTKKYDDQMDANALWDSINQVLRGSGESQDVALQRVIDLLDVPGGYWDPNYYQGRPTGEDSGKWIPPTKEEVEAYIRQQAAAMGMSAADYVRNAAVTDPGMVWDPVGQTYMTREEYSGYIQKRAVTWNMSPGTSGLANAVPPYNPAANPTAGTIRVSPGYYIPREFGTNPMLTAEGDAIARSMYALAPYSAVPGRNFISTTGETAIGGATGGGLDAGTREGAYSPTAPGLPYWAMGNPQADVAKYAADAKAYTAALYEQMGVYAPLIEGINSASDAQRMFKATQDGLLQQSSVFQAQQSEYGGVLADMEAGYEILQRRQAEGIELSAREQEFMKNYAANSERMTGAVEDAIIGQALLSGEYAENVTKGDELNRTLAGNTESTNNLVSVIYDLILAMDGIPEEVRSRIEIERAQESLGELQGIASWLNSLDGFTANAYVNVQQTGVAIGSPSGPSILPGDYLGGVVGYANGGLVRTMLAEAGPELLYFQGGGVALAAQRGVYAVPQGTYVSTAPETKSKLAGGMGGVRIDNATFIFQGFTSQHEVQRQLQEFAFGGSRG